MATSSTPSRADPRSSLWLLALLLGASVEPVLVKLGYRNEASPWQLLALKNVVAACVVVPLTRGRAWLGTRDLLRVAPLALLLFATNALTLLALTRVSAVTSMTVAATTPAAVGLVTQLRGRTRTSAVFWGALALCVTGTALSLDVAGRAAREDAWGLAAALAAVATSTAYRSVLEDVTRTVPPAVVSFWIFVVNATLSLAVLAPLAGLPPRNALPWGVIIGVAAGVANLAFVVALQRLGAARVSVFTLLQRPIVMVLAALVLAEPLGGWKVAGIALVLVGVYLAPRGLHPVAIAQGAKP